MSSTKDMNEISFLIYIYFYALNNVMTGKKNYFFPKTFFRVSGG